MAEPVVEPGPGGPAACVTRMCCCWTVCTAEVGGWRCWCMLETATVPMDVTTVPEVPKKITIILKWLAFFVI